jgi:protein-tyrosine phosphatase
MIDLRCNILDGTPYGPDSFAESLEMCRAAVADGVSTIVATPRWEAGRAEPPLPFEDCQRKIERLGAETHGALSFRLGFALQFSAALPRLAAQHGSKLALAGKRHLLISLPSLTVPVEAEDVWKSLARCGFSVILAHPECNTVLRRDSTRLARWVLGGLTLQIDAASVAGTHGREVRRFAVECLRKYEGHAVVASNARSSADQKISLGRAREVLTGNIGARQARSFMRDTPTALIGDGVRHGNEREFSSRSLSSLFHLVGPFKPLRGNS